MGESETDKVILKCGRAQGAARFKVVVGWISMVLRGDGRGGTSYRRRSPLLHSIAALPTNPSGSRGEPPPIPLASPPRPPAQGRTCEPGKGDQEELAIPSQVHWPQPARWN